ncbi:uncharacterized protein LOC142342061 [Convolutriloba macropyga]|uniref:uncharacterized protein LOC142342061 n=1 Tax=Convolutriloba macropyga TaxID=536237 RepID=UPI003F526FEA
MADKGAMYKACSGLGIPVQIFFYIMLFFFWWPAMWYYDTEDVYATEHSGGVLQWCTQSILQSWECVEVTESIAKFSLDHEWSHYQAIKAFVSLADMVAFLVLILYYVQLCIKSHIIAAVSTIGAALQCLFTLIACGIATSLFSEVGVVDTDPSYSLFLVWVGWIASIGNVALAACAGYAAFSDKDN